MSQHAYTVRPLLDSWIGFGAPTIEVVAYSALPRHTRFPAGACIFADIERLTPPQTELAEALWDRLSSAGDSVRLLNHPRRTLRRFDLLERLYAEGINRFRAFRVANGWQDWKYPVFLREANEHSGSLSILIRNDLSLRRRIIELLLEGHRPEDLLVVEFCDTADAGGVYRKYSAFRVGDRILPRHVLFSRDWVQKDLDLLDEHLRDEVREYCRLNPHENELHEIFALANIEYGRIDYSLLDGSIQVWEINTNPVVIKARHKYSRRSRLFHERFLRAFGVALHALSGVPGSGVSVNWDDVDPTDLVSARGDMMPEAPELDSAR